MKTCYTCRQTKPLSFFATHVNRKDGLQSHCKDCQKSYRREHYVKNKQKYIDKASKWGKTQRKILYEWMDGKKCVDCGNPDIRVLQFDHKKDKKFCISKKISSLKFESIKSELDKCEIVCANCHTIRTSTQFKWAKSKSNSNG